MIDKDSLPLDKPRRTPDHPTKSHVVKTRVDGKEKIIRFGEQGASTAGKPKQGESERMTAKRASFKARHAKNIAKGKSSAAYWANKVKWATGGSVELEDLNSKYEGIKKPDFSLLDSFKGMIKTLQSRAEETQGQEFDPLETLKPNSAAPTLEDLYSSYAAEPAAGPAGHAGRVEAGVAPSDALALAASQMGLSEGGQRAAIQDYLTTGGANLDPATTAWCAAFVNSTLQQTGVQGTGSNMARSFLDWGQSVDQPQEGDLAVFSRGDPSGPYGHVGFFKGYDDQGNILVLGGNQGDAVSISPYPRESLLGFRRAGEAEPQKFAEGGGVPAPKRSEPETSSLTGFPEIDRMIIALGNVNQLFNPIEAIGDSMDASKRMLAPETEGWDRVAALGDMLSGVGGVVAPVATAARAGTPATAALMESLLGGSPATTAMGDTAKDIGRKIVERANQRGPVPVMGSNFGNVLGDADEGRLLYHAGTYTPGEPIKRPLFTSADRDFAESYVDPNRIEGSQLTAFRAAPKSTAYEDEIMRMASKYLPEFEEMGYTPASAFDENLFDPSDISRMISDLRGRGYDSAEISDVAMSGNREGKALVLFPDGEYGIKPVTPGIEAADRIADMLRTGRADEITDELADQADPQRMMYHYTSGNTGMDLPMDQASRMERSKQMGFRGDLYSGTGEDFTGFRTESWATDNPDLAYAYAPPIGGNIMPLMMRAERGAPVINAGGSTFNMLSPSMLQQRGPKTLRLSGFSDVPDEIGEIDRYGPEDFDLENFDLENFDLKDSDRHMEEMYLTTEDIADVADEQGFSGVTFNDMKDVGKYLRVYGPNADPESVARAGQPSRVEMRLSPNQVRSRFARFDPRLGHLSHLNYAEGGTVNANFNRDRQRDDLRTIGDTVYERRADGVLSPLSRVKYATSKPAEPDTGSRTGFPELDRMLVSLGNLNEALNPMVAIQNSQKASRRMFEPNISGWDRMAAAGDMLSNVAGVVAPAALSARAGVPAATALMESLVGGSPTMTAVGDTARDVGRKIVERANQRGPVPVMGSNFGSLFPPVMADPYARRAADRVAEMLRTGREDEITEELFAQADPQRLTQHYASGNTGMDMPMDYASRMARAKEQGFRGDLYHATDKDFSAFDRNAIYATDNPQLAYTYAPDQGGRIMPLMMREKHGVPVVDAGGSNFNMLTPYMREGGPGAPYLPEDALSPVSLQKEVEDYLSGEKEFLNTLDFEEAAKKQGFSGVKFNDMVDLGPYFNNHNLVLDDAEYADFMQKAEKPSTVETRFYPNLVRSKFARFDPRLFYLGNLSAGVAAGAVGLEAAQYDPDQVDTIADTVRKREFATGGAVKYDPAAVDNIINQIREVNRG